MLSALHKPSRSLTQGQHLASTIVVGAMAREVGTVAVETTKVLTLVVAQRLVVWVVVTMMGTNNRLYVYASHTDSSASDTILSISGNVHPHKRRNSMRSMRKSWHMTDPLIQVFHKPKHLWTRLL